MPASGKRPVTTLLQKRGAKNLSATFSTHRGLADFLQAAFKDELAEKNAKKNFLK
jgi:hypothetical protein